MYCRQAGRQAQTDTHMKHDFWMMMSAFAASDEILHESQAGRQVQTDKQSDMTCEQNGFSVLHL